MQYLLGPIIIGFLVLFCFILNKCKTLPHLYAGGSRFSYIDGLRGIASAIVVCAHAWRFEWTGIKNETFLSFDHPYNQAFGAIGVQTFFCITGFLFTGKLISNKNIDWHDFYMSRLKRIAPLYVFMVLLVVFTTIALSNNPTLDLIPKSFHLFLFDFIPLNYHAPGFNAKHILSMAWTLKYEWAFYFSLPFLSLFFTSIKNTVSLFLIAFIAMLCLFYTDPYNAWSFFVIGSALRFANGVNIKNRFISEVFFIIASIGLIYSASLDDPKFGYVRFLFMAIFFTSVIIGKPRFLASPALRLLGEISYSVYLLHLLVFLWFGKVLSALIGGVTINDFEFIMLTGCYCLVLVVVCTITFKKIEYPLLRKKESGKIIPPESNRRM